MTHGDVLKRQLAAMLLFVATGAAIIAAGVSLQTTSHPTQAAAAQVAEAGR